METPLNVDQHLDPTRNVRDSSPVGSEDVVQASDEAVNSFAESRREFEELLSQSREKIILFLYTLVHQQADAEDLCQRSSIVMWQKFSEFDRRKSFLAWACGIARLEAFNYRRAQAAAPIIFQSDVAQLLATSLETFTLSPETQRLAALQKCLQRLPDRDRTFLTRIYWEGCAFDTIAEELGCSPRTFYNRMYLLRRRLFQCVARRLKAESAGWADSWSE